MFDNEIVSIIVPIYNVSKYLENCISSVSNQTYKKTEIILVNDGSTDGSLVICQKWATMDDRIRIVNKENGGLSSARNAGMSVAKGKYILFVDGDDTISEDLVSLVLPHFSEGVDAVSFGYNLVYDHGEIEQIHFEEKIYDLKEDRTKRNFLYGVFFRHLIGWEAWNKIYLHDTISNNNLYFINTKSEDLGFNLCFNSVATTIVNLDLCLYNYLQRDDSIMGKLRTSKQSFVYMMNNMSMEVLRFFKSNKKCQALVDSYPIIHYLLIQGDLVFYGSTLYRANQYRSNILKELTEYSDIDFFIENLKGFKTHKKELSDTYNYIQIAEKKACVDFLLNGHSLTFYILESIRALRNRLRSIVRK